jgi:hypothetical protein
MGSLQPVSHSLFRSGYKYFAKVEMQPTQRSLLQLHCSSLSPAAQV